jgi:Tfp pilus assembly protein PilV
MGFFLFLIVLVLIGVAVMSAADTKAKQLEEARQAYQQSLGALKQRPTNPDLKQRTLALGRAYSNLTREQQGKGGVTLYDEVALSNDISAACAAAATHVSAATAPRQSPEARLEKLSELRTRGLVTDDEYASERRRILSEI